MSTQPLTRTASVPQALRADSIVHGAVHLSVVDLERSLAFWRDLVGLQETEPADGRLARLGVEDRALIVLHAGAVRPAGRGHAGLYHVAIHLPDDVEFARVLMRLFQARVAHSPTDHVFSKATYLHDPDGILLELTLETPERYGSLHIEADEVWMTDEDGRRRGPTEPLDVLAALAPLGEDDPHLPMPAGAYVGHVHLHVPDLRAANDFYRDVIGFSEHAYMAAVRMADLSAGGRFPHRLALNTWQGPNARQAPEGTAGMIRYELIVRGEGALDALAARAERAHALDASAGARAGLNLLDPAGNRIAVSQERT